MRTFLIFFLAASMMLVAAPVAADAPEFPDFTPMQIGPEGVAIDNVGNVYVSVGIAEFGYTELWKFDTAGDGSVLTVLPGPLAAGLAVDANGTHVYAAQGFAGVFKVDMAGDFELVPGTNALVLPNSLAFDKHGNLFVTETFSFDVNDGLSYYANCDGAGFDGWFGRGGIWMVPAGGEAELLMRDDLLTGECVDNPIPYPIGANGLAYRHGSLIVANSEKALLLEVPVLDHGELGEIEVLAHLAGTSPFGAWMIDGVALDVHGNIYAAMVVGSLVIRVDANGDGMEIVATPADGLTFPASLAFGTGNGERQSIFVTNLAFAVPDGFAGPGLSKIDVGQPGMPLP